MTFTFKLARRTAGLGLMLLGLVAGCDESQTFEPGEEADLASGNNPVVRVDLKPDAISCAAGADVSLTATPYRKSGAVATDRTVTFSVKDTAKASVTATGLQTARLRCKVAGTSMAVAAISAKRDSSTITIGSATSPITAVVLTPATVSLAPGGTQQFSASGKRSDGSTVAITASYQATGGTVSSGGMYSAGSTTGTYRVIAILSGGTLADTSTVTIAASAPSTGCGSIAIAPGQSIQAAVNAASTGASFCLKAGTHARQSVLPKTGQTFVCEAGAVLDGQNVATMAFYSQNGNPDNVTIRGCRITRYNPGTQGGAVMAGGASTSLATDNWLLEDVEVSYSNTGTGVVIGSRMTCRRCNLHHNDSQNISGTGRRTVIEDSELAWGNYRKLNNWGYSGGGSKFVMTDSLIVRRTYVHDNYGPGLWTDVDNIRTTFESNRVEDNAGPGIYQEIGYSVTIRNNQVRRNGFGFTGWVWGAGIQISSSGGTGGEQIEIAGNVVEGNKMDIMAVQQSRGSGPYGAHLTQNIWVHDNTVSSLNGAQSGAASDDGSNLATRNLRWDRNTYSANHARPFGWSNAARTWSEWRSFGHDASGSYQQK